MTTPTTLASAPSPPAAPLSATEVARRARINVTAQNFEASFLSSMFQTMFEGTEGSAPFGGGQAETAWRSMLTDAMAHQVVRTGGIGLAASVAREMIRMQETAAAPAGPDAPAADAPATSTHPAAGAAAAVAPVGQTRSVTT